MNVEISLVPEVITVIGGFPITNTFLMTIVVSIMIIVGSIIFSKRNNMVPRGFQNLVESVLEALFGLVDSVTGNREQSRKFFPIVATIFIFVIFSNWIGLLPGMGTVGVNQIHHGENILVSFIRSPSADLNVTLMLALVSVIAAQIMGIRAIGFKHYVGKFFVSPLKKPYGIGTFVGILELISEFAKIISFSFRLFGNVFAGEVLLLVILSLAAVFVPLPFLILEVFIGMIQALVFAMLTLVFFKMATEESH
ncbi:MAG: ATP synthase F0 subunit A [Candidatus Moraniibacteriota bacterium]|nr:MAG: ATP synthase F0 subunit A [Candidatus Moranbacteria bacterium]